VEEKQYKDLVIRKEIWRQPRLRVTAAISDPSRLKEIPKIGSLVMSRLSRCVLYSCSSAKYFNGGFEYSTRLLKYALPLVKEHGFSREALARSVLSIPTSETFGETHTDPLSETAVSALFGDGDEARRTLIKAWLQHGLTHMGTVPGVVRPVIINVEGEDVPETGRSTEVNAARQEGPLRKATVEDVLRARLEYNEPVLGYLPEVRLASLKEKSRFTQ